MEESTGDDYEHIRICHGRRIGGDLRGRTEPGAGEFRWRHQLPLSAHHMRDLMTLLLDVLLYIVAWAHVLLAPYTKVEESFTLHAIHDLLFYGGHPDALQKVSLQQRHRLAPSH